MSPFAAIVAGGVGALARYAVTAWVQRGAGARFPAGTAAVNLAGSFAFGVAAGALEFGTIGFALAAGFLGGFTTFSTWMVETLRLAQRGAGRVLALANLTVLLSIGVAVAALGYRISG